MNTRTTAIAGLVAMMLMTAGPAHAEVGPQPAVSHFYPLQPSFSQSPQSEADEIRRQIADLDGSWNSLSPQDRNQRLTQLQQLLTNLDFETRDMPQDQKAGVDVILLPSLVNLANLVRKSQGPNQPCYFPACLPGL